MKLFHYALAAVVVMGSVFVQVQAGVAKPQSSPDLDEPDSVSVETGIVDSDVQMTGTAIINGVVFIDGEKLPADKKIYTSRKTGKTYLIKRGKNGNVSVVEK